MRKVKGAPALVATADLGAEHPAGAHVVSPSKYRVSYTTSTLSPDLSVCGVHLVAEDFLQLGAHVARQAGAGWRRQSCR